MTWSTKRRPELWDDLNILIGDLCTRWGFCNRLGGEDLVGNGEHLHADRFARAVLEAAGLNPEFEIQWFRRFRRLFIERYGKQSISPAEYRREAAQRRGG